MLSPAEACKTSAANAVFFNCGQTLSPQREQVPHGSIFLELHKGPVRRWTELATTWRRTRGQEDSWGHWAEKVTSRSLARVWCTRLANINLVCCALDKHSASNWDTRTHRPPSYLYHLGFFHFVILSLSSFSSTASSLPLLFLPSLTLPRITQHSFVRHMFEMTNRPIFLQESY